MLKKLLLALLALVSALAALTLDAKSSNAAPVCFTLSDGIVNEGLAKAFDPDHLCYVDRIGYLITIDRTGNCHNDEYYIEINDGLDNDRFVAAAFRNCKRDFVIDNSGGQFDVTMTTCDFDDFKDYNQKGPNKPTWLILNFVDGKADDVTGYRFKELTKSEEWRQAFHANILNDGVIGAIINMEIKSLYAARGRSIKEQDNVRNNWLYLLNQYHMATEWYSRYRMAIEERWSNRLALHTL